MVATITTIAREWQRSERGKERNSGTPVNKPNGRKAHNLKHSLWEANDITDIRLSQANDNVDMDECACMLKIVSKISVA